MDDKKFRKLLEQLHAQIEQTEKMDDQGRELLRHVNADINELLARTEGAPLKPKPALAHSLEAAISHFEVTHPTLTAALSDLLNALSNAGI
ncbi:MAG: DUF4404 family protein [Chloroflexi bacterium]|nr:DUF4404 family protein [Chloroflexota bacterium]